MLRRELIKALAAAAVVWPLAAQAQPYPRGQSSWWFLMPQAARSTSWAAFSRRG